MSKSITHQLQHAVHNSVAFGESKYAERRKGPEYKQTKSKTYAYTTLKTKLDTAKTFGNYLREHHPEIRLATQITPELAQEFLNHSANKGNSAATLTKQASNLRSIFRHCEKTYQDFKKYEVEKLIQTPDAKPELQPLRTAAGMPDKDILKILNGLKSSNNLFKAVYIIRLTGARADGIANLKGSDIHIENGKCTVHLCEKGGRERDVDIIHADYIHYFERLSNEYGNGYIVNHQGRPLQPKSIEKALNRRIKKLDLSRTYNYEKCHCIRKCWAQTRYNEYRHAGHSKRESIQYINQQLGHSADRDEALLNLYVSQIW